MAHFAKVNQNNIVEQVLVVPDEQEHRGQEFLAVDLQLGGKWIQTSFNHKIRRRFALPGYLYREDVDAFQPPAPTYHASFIWDEYLWDWTPPIPAPKDADWVIGFQDNPFHIQLDNEGNDVLIIPQNAKVYNWDEQSVSWVIVQTEMPQIFEAESETMTFTEHLIDTQE